LTADDLQIRKLTPADDLEAELSLRRRSFGPLSVADRPSWVDGLRYSIDSGHMVGVFDGAQLVGSARYHPMRQWWHGRSLPMAAVAGVKMAPEERGRGAGRAMMARLVAEIAAAGYPLSALYPTTAPVYRASGYEFAGHKYETVLPGRALTALVPPPQAAAPVKLRRAIPDDAGLVIEIKDRVHAALRHCGPVIREARELREWLDDENHFTYLADDGFLSYRWARGTDEIAVEEVTAGSAATTRAFWQIVGSHATMADTVRAYLAPADPVSWLLRDLGRTGNRAGPDGRSPTAQTRTKASWMLRVIDAPAAVAGRGYPAAARLRTELELTDALLPANAGRWTLEVGGGEGRLRRATDSGPGAGLGRAGDNGPLRLDVRGLAALYGGIPMTTLRLAGLVTAGSPAADDDLDCAFTGSAFMTYDF
jgi:predicted acetyltransferase